MSVRFLLITRLGDTDWPLILNQSLAALGTVEIASESDAIERIARYRCHAVVIIDATVVEDVPALILRLRERCSECPVVVATASPTWQRARNAFQAGAVDYIRKSRDSEELLNAIREILSRFLPHEVEDTEEA